MSTGAVTGGIVPLFDRLPKPTLAQQVDGTRRFFRELNRLALTGVIDPCGNNVTPETYDAIHRVWRSRALTVPCCVHDLWIQPGPRVGGLPKIPRAHAHGFRRRHDALQRHRRADHLGHRQQRTSRPGRPGAALRRCEMGGGARVRAHVPLRHGCGGGRHPHGVRTGASRGAAHEPALVARAHEQRVAGQPPPDEGARHGLDDAGRHVFRW